LLHELLVAVIQKGNGLTYAWNAVLTLIEAGVFTAKRREGAIVEVVLETTVRKVQAYFKARKSVAEPHPTSDIREAEQPTQATDTGGVHRRKRPERSRSRNEARDKWIYEECRRGTQYKTIVAKLKTKPESWDRIESIQGIRHAARQYARRNGLPPPPPRQSTE
jgi:hypothetical protein